MSILRLAAVLVAYGGLLLFPVPSQAAITLTLNPKAGTDLANLTVGQTITIEVSLSGLVSGDNVGYLAATATFNGGILGSAFNVTAGSSVPDSTGFLGVGASTFADGSYDYLFSSSGSPITDNGMFYSFDVTPQGLGSGTFAFDVQFLAGRDLLDQPIALNVGQPLPFTVRIATTAPVPEPSSLSIFGAALLCVTGLHRWKRRVQYRRIMTPV